jgi:ketosteroid isomerase-like protein
MSHANVEIVREVFDREARRDASVLDAYDPEVEMDFSASPFADFMTMSGRRQGLGEVQSAFRDWYEAFDNVERGRHVTESANVELVRSIYAAWERSDFSQTEWAHPEIEYVQTGQGPQGLLRRRGLARMADAWRDWLSGWEDFRTEAEDVAAVHEGIEVAPRELVAELAVGQDRGAHAELSELEDAGHAEGGGGGQRAASQAK